MKYDWLFDLKFPNGNAYSIYNINKTYVAEGVEFEENIDSETLDSLINKLIKMNQ